VDSLTLASPRATARWSLSISFPAFQRSSGRWTCSPWQVCAPRRVGLYLFLFQPSRVPLEGGLAHLGESARHGVLAFLFYFIPSLPEILWKVGSLAWRVRAPRRVGLYLFLFQPSRVPLEGGLAHLGESARHGALAFLFLFHSQPSRDPLEGGLASLASPRATACWPLFLSFPAFQSSSGGWTRSPWRVRVPRRVGLYVLCPQPSRDPLEGGLVHLASLRAMARWPFFFYFIPSLPEILWKVGLLAWYVCTLQCIGCATRCWPLCVYFHLSQGCSSGTLALRLCYPA
jgi:hypothetical protein